jgi:hypothetical protein
MMPFGRSRSAQDYYNRIHEHISAFVEGMGINLDIAHQRRLSDSLWDGIATQMDKSWAGVAVVDSRKTLFPSENVFVEIGFMLSFGKPVLVLREESSPPLPSDLSWLRYEVYSGASADRGIRKALALWIEQLAVVPYGLRRLAD